MKFGFEVEGIINTGRLNLPVGDYHNGLNLSNNWETQRDGSLNTSGFFDVEQAIEFVSEVFNNEEEAINGLRELRDILIKKGKSKKMSNLIYFNDSCGGHIHFSIENYSFWKSAGKSIFYKTTNYFIENLKKNKSISEETRQKVNTQYFRSYARFLDINSVRQRHDRRVEWNFESEEEEKGFEWRSFNLCGCKDWSEFFNLYKLAFKTLRFLEKQVKIWTEKEKVILEEEFKKNKKVKRNLRINLIKEKPFKEFDINIKEKNKEVFIECVI